MVGETGHWVGLDLRDGNVHTANGAGEMLLPLVDKARQEIADKVYVRGDAGFPGADLLDQLDERDVSYAFRIPTNRDLQQWEEILAVRPPGRPPEVPRIWTHNVTYQAATWKAPRHVVVVVQERPGELYLHTFFILSSFTEDEMSADETVDFYRERALIENHIGEHQSFWTRTSLAAIAPNRTSSKSPSRTRKSQSRHSAPTLQRSCCAVSPTTSRTRYAAWSRGVSKSKARMECTSRACAASS